MTNKKYTAKIEILPAEESELIKVKISLAEPTRELFKKVCLSKKTSFQLEDKSYDRYLMKKWVLEAIQDSYYRDRGYLSSVDLVDNGSLELELSSLSNVENIANNIKQCIKILLENKILVESTGAINIEITDA